MKTDCNKTPLASRLGIEHWSDGHFHASTEGVLQVCLPGLPAQTLSDIVAHCQQSGLAAPLLLRFPQILQLRAERLQQAFSHAFEQYHVEGNYRVIYPIKVNQQFSVVQTLAGTGQGQNGLEAGSKAELLAVMALAQPGSPIVCNGYKDQEYIELACLAARMGLDPVLVIEQRDEWERIQPVFQHHQTVPRLGLRLRLRTIGHGKWQNTGGVKAKFGLSASAVLQLIHSIDAKGFLPRLQVLHFHMGSQISNLRDIQRGAGEAARFLVACRQAGAPIQVMDIGGGLGVDYEGAHARSACSMNYGFDQYAQTVVHALHQACTQNGMPLPAIWSESGRALTAHHAVLVAHAHSLAVVQASTQAVDNDIARLEQQLNTRPAEEIYYEAETLLAEAHDRFLHGELELENWAEQENSHRALCLQLLQHLQPGHRRHQPILDELHERMADKLFLNFSVFRSIPDSWAIEQLFPIAPLQGLNQQAGHHVMVEDLTCDSDGRVDAFPLDTGVESILPIPAMEHNPQGLFGIFLVGAYQEVLGDNHNLFGLPHAVDIHLTEAGFELQAIQAGDTRQQVLQAVGYHGQALRRHWQTHMQRQALSAQEQESLLNQLDQALQGYTYLEFSPPTQ